jgi:hypothetical protein
VRKPKPERLPKHPDWKLVPEPNAASGQLTLRYGIAVLRIRFWPRASTALRMTPDGPWISGDRHAGRLLRRYFSRVRFRHVPIDGQLHWVDPDGQLYFPFMRQHSEEMGNTPAERAYIGAISHIPHEVGATLLQFKQSHWDALRLAYTGYPLVVTDPQPTPRSSAPVTTARYYSIGTLYSECFTANECPLSLREAFWSYRCPFKF